MPAPRAPTEHASCVALGDRAVLIRGRSGAGKSTLAVQLIGLGATLVADDRVVITERGHQVLASPPDPLAGLIEARGIGLMRLAHKSPVSVVLVVDLDQQRAARLPQMLETSFTDTTLPLIAGKNRPNLAYEVLALLRDGLHPLLHDPETPMNDTNS